MDGWDQCTSSIERFACFLHHERNGTLTGGAAAPQSAPQPARTPISIGIVGGGPAGLTAALVLDKMTQGFVHPLNITVYEKRTKRTRPQTLFLDFENIVGLSGIGGTLKRLFHDLWTSLQTKNTCIVTAPFFGDPTCFKVKDLAVFAELDKKTYTFPAIPNKLGGLSIPIRSLETALEEFVATRPNITIVRKEIKNVNDIIPDHAIILGCEGRKSIVADALKSKKMKLPGVQKSHELHAVLVRWKAKKPTIVEDGTNSPNDAQHRFRIFHSPDGTVTFIVQFRLKKKYTGKWNLKFRDMRPTLQRIAQNEFARFSDTLGDIPEHADAVVISIDPYYRKKAAAVVQTSHGTSMLALLGDSLMGVSFLSGWGLNSAFRQIDTFEQSMRQAEQNATTVRNSVSETLWLHNLSNIYQNDLFYGQPWPMKESIIRTLAVVPKTEFKGTKADMNNTAWNERSAVLVEETKFPADAKVMSTKKHIPLSVELRRQLEKQLHDSKSNLPEAERGDGLWAWWPDNPKLEDLPDWKYLDKHLAIVQLAHGFADEWKASTSADTRGLWETPMQLLETQAALADTGFLLRPDLNMQSEDKAYTIRIPRLDPKYAHIEVKVPSRPAGAVRVRAMVACMTVVDTAWGMIRAIQHLHPDVTSFIFSKSDFEDGKQPRLPIVRSLLESDGQATSTHVDHEDAVAQLMEAIKHHLDRLETPTAVADGRALVLVDMQFGRHINHLLGAMKAAHETGYNAVYKHPVGNSSLYK